MDEVKLALELNRVVHNECKDVPHDIGLRLLEVVKKHIGEQLNIPHVSVSVCYNRDCFYYDKTDNTCVGNYKACTVKQTERYVKVLYARFNGV